MGKRLKHTPNSQIKSALHRLFLRSRERGEVVKRDEYTCRNCRAKKSVRKGAEVKINVHHKNPVIWQDIIAYIRANLLVDPDQMEVLCVDCHKEEHKKEGT